MSKQDRNVRPDDKANQSSKRSTGGPVGDVPAVGTEEFVPAGDVGDDPITRTLKMVYADVTSEPIPDRLLNLLSELDSDNEGDGHDERD